MNLFDALRRFSDALRPLQDATRRVSEVVQRFQPSSAPDVEIDLAIAGPEPEQPRRRIGFVSGPSTTVINGQSLVVR